ncbi:hybrid sensor histidine kinase/response regulator [Achromobacter sp. Marseille-Q0513]|uniref:hybrid sensor histidine kinase/response regulator n=1 Tax=Achromobacter sp. Marseille-Q0513 TaxID=2829161 RepID=UPI001B90FB69|nr:hybrid sensor histidine kinase/response regulator [Achromobacter sp. Marseille-Q0513]MBR8655665.1 hybrid sensor histidine kinase/response regulator [Achromobacter sp. Marseille-Q0513]
MPSRRAGWLAWLLWLVLSFLVLPARGQIVQPVVDLNAVGGTLPLVHELLGIEDKAGGQDAGQVLNGAWQPVTSAWLNRGYSASAFWLRLQVRNSGDQVVERWLSFGVPRLEDVRFYLFSDGQREPSRVVLAGNRQPLATREVPASVSVATLRLAPGERMTVLIRVQSRSALSMEPTLRTPAAFVSVTQRNTMVVALLVGALMMVGIYAGLLGVTLRDRVFLLLSAAIFVEILYSLSFQGLLYRYVLTGGGELVLRAPSVLGSLATTLFASMSMLFADLQRIRLWRWVYGLQIVVGIAGLFWAALGDYRVSAQVLTGLVFLWALIWLVSMADGWRRGHANARIFLISFSIYCSCLFLRVAYIHGLLPGRWEGGPEVAWDLLSISLMLAVLLHGRSRQHRQERLAAQRELAEAREREHQRLDQAVTERTQALQAALIQADEAGRVRQDFLARISHDLRTPLTSIIGFADLIQAGGRDDAPRGAVIRRSADHMLGMVNDLIDYAAGAGGQSLRLAPEYAHALLDALAKEAAPIAARQENRFVLQVSDAVPAVLEMDGKRVRQVLSNLIDNAAKFTRGGVLTLTAGYAAPGPGEASGWLALALRDTGCGIAQEDRQRIFEPFQRLASAESQPGVGLGLAIVQQWVQRMNGAIRIESEVGQGTTVSVTLPVRQVDESRVSHHYLAAAAHMLPTLDGTGKRLWLAEDTPEIREFLVEELASLGFQVESEADGLAMVTRIQADDARRPDLILTDHRMEGADGSAVLAAARERWPGLPVVAVSATPQDALALDGSGYDASLLKPISLAELRHVLGRLLHLPMIQAGNETAPVARQLPRLSRAEQEQVQLLLDSGAISDLMDWARAARARDPAFKDFSEQVQRLARQGDIAAIRELCERMRAA